jgi:hypothetical protein
MLLLSQLSFAREAIQPFLKHKSITMKLSIQKTGHAAASKALVAATALLMFSACSKDVDHPHHPQGPPSIEVTPSQHSPEVLLKWMRLQTRLMKNTAGPNHGFSRHMAYSGIAAVEALKPGGGIHAAWSNKWNGLTGLPNSNTSQKFYLPQNLNAALAGMNRAMFPTANATDKAAIDSLENALYQEFLQVEKKSKLDQSTDFGKAVATAVFNWSETDGYKVANAPYTVPLGFGLWKPTPPAFAPPATPYWGNNRPVIIGSLTGAQAAPAPAYSETAESPFYTHVNNVYQVSLSLTDAQKAMAIFWRDVPGVTSPGHWLNIIEQTAVKTNSSLEKTALAYALTGAGINDALIACFKDKYTYNVVRPITYIRDVLGYNTWNTVLGTPAHPEYPSAHSSLSSAAGEALQKLYGNMTFTDHTYDYLGMQPRTYSNFVQIGQEAGNSRVFAGIHYQVSVDQGFLQGKKVAHNIFK